MKRAIKELNYNLESIVVNPINFKSKILDVVTGEILKEVATPKGSKPLMHTNHPTNGQLWVQESGSNTNAIYDPVTLDLIKRFPSAKGPVVGTFSPDGKYAYIGHFGAPVVQVVTTDTYEEMKRITVGSTPNKIAVHPSGKEIYAIATKEASIVVINYGTWTVQKERIEKRVSAWLKKVGGKIEKRIRPKTMKKMRDAYRARQKGKQISTVNTKKIDARIKSGSVIGESNEAY
mgnify:CR=1 FL=1